jgi:hypothetical protein
VTVIEVPLAAEEEVELVPQEMVVSEDSAETHGAESDQSDAVAQSLAPTLAEISVVPVEDEPDAVVDVLLDLVHELPTAQELDAAVIVKGSVGVGTTGAVGAVDLLTAEIAAALSQRPTGVCWVFDQSVSLSAQRRQIADRLDRVFDELGANRSSGRLPGQGWSFRRGLSPARRVRRGGCVLVAWACVASGGLRPAERDAFASQAIVGVFRIGRDGCHQALGQAIRERHACHSSGQQVR